MKKIIVSSLMLVCSLSFAQVKPTTPPDPSVVELTVADGSSSGTYKKFLDEIQSAVTGVIQFREVPSNGAIKNLDLLINNQVQCAFMHSDVIQFRAQREEGLSTKFQTLLALFKEEVHFVAMSQSKRTTGGRFGIGKSTVVFNSVGDLKGYKVGAAGGGYITAQVINQQVNYEVVQYQKGDDVLVALAAGDIDAGVFVGGAPLPNLVNLGPEYKILPINDNLAVQLKGNYSAASITYTAMRPEAVATVAADCVLVARVYKTPRFVAALKKFRALFNERLVELQETNGTHPKWQEVKPNAQGKWMYMELGN